MNDGRNDSSVTIPEAFEDLSVLCLYQKKTEQLVKQAALAVGTV